MKAATRAHAQHHFELAGSNSRPIRGQALEPEFSRGTIVLCHGFRGFSRWGFWPYLSQALARAQFRAVSFDFSGSGIGPDRESFTDLEGFEQNSYTKELADIDVVIAECDRRRWITSGYGLLGHSRGGGMAILHASRSSRTRALATWSAMAKLPGIDASLDLEAAAARLRIPWLIAHGTDDETVPMASAEILHRRSTSGVANLMLVHGANHVFQATHPFGSPSPQLREVVERTVGFFDRHLR